MRRGCCGPIPTGAAVFDAASPSALTGSAIDPKGTAALQIARIAGTLPHGAAPRLERLRGFGGRFGRALMCACTRVTLADRSAAILVVATEPAGPSLAARRARPAAARRRRRAGRAVCAATAVCCTPPPAGQASSRPAHRSRRSASSRSAGAALAAGQAGRSHVGAISVERIGRDAVGVLLVTFASAEAGQARCSSSRATPATPPAVEAPTPAQTSPAADIAAPRQRRSLRRAATNRRRPPPPNAASRCASSGRWMRTAASRSALTNSSP